MSLFLFYLALLALLAVVVVLGVGIYSLFRGGDFKTRWSNKLMRPRVLMQAIAIIILIAFFVVSHNAI